MAPLGLFWTNRACSVRTELKYCSTCATSGAWPLSLCAGREKQGEGGQSRGEQGAHGRDMAGEWGGIQARGLFPIK